MEDLMTENQQLSEEEQFKEFKRQKRKEEAAANVARIECDCLSANLDKTALRELCRTANSLCLGGIIVSPSVVRACVTFLGSDPQTSLIAAISSPVGGDTTEGKVAAVKRAIKDGVDETEVWAPLFFIKEGNFVYLKKECKKLRKASHNRAIRIVLDCVVLREQEIVKACTTIADAGINCIRLNGADGELVAKIKAAVKGKCLVKCDGGETLAAFTNLTVMGADYVSSSSACELANFILKQAEGNA